MNILRPAIDVSFDTVMNIFCPNLLVSEDRACRFIHLQARMSSIGHKPTSHHVFFPDSLLIEFP